VRSGVAAYSADVLPLLAPEFAIDVYVDAEACGRAPDGDARLGAAAVRSAHEFLWRHRRHPYDLIVYQLGNAPWHDYLWAYLAAYPGLVVLHDARLHHARARALLSRGRADDYRAEFAFNHPEAPPGAAEFAVEGLAGSVYYVWPMIRTVIEGARMIAVHNRLVAAELGEQYPGAAIETIRMGVAAPGGRPEELAAAARRALAIPPGAVVFVVFGKMTAEKRVGPILRAFNDLARSLADVSLLFVGEPGEPAPALDGVAADRIRVVGYVSDADVDGYLAAADVCLCLRWPTALETSASWIRCLAAGRATIITNLAHLADVPAADPEGRRLGGSRPPVAIAIDLLDEERSLFAAMRRLASDRGLRDALGAAGRAHWAREHRLELMASDYRRVIQAARARPAPDPAGLPAHLMEDYSGHARRIAALFGLDVDVLQAEPAPAPRPAAGYNQGVVNEGSRS